MASRILNEIEIFENLDRGSSKDPLCKVWWNSTKPRGYTTFSCSTQLSMKFQLFIKTKILMFLALSLSDFVFIMLINVKMPTIVVILTYMSRINFVPSWDEHGKSFMTSGSNSFGDVVKAICWQTQDSGLDRRTTVILWSQQLTLSLWLKWAIEPMAQVS